MKSNDIQSWKDRCYGAEAQVGALRAALEKALGLILAVGWNSDTSKAFLDEAIEVIGLALAPAGPVDQGPAPATGEPSHGQPGVEGTAREVVIGCQIRHRGFNREQAIASAAEGWALEACEECVRVALASANEELDGFHRFDAERMARWRDVLGWTGPMDEPRMQEFAATLRVAADPAALPRSPKSPVDPGGEEARAREIVGQAWVLWGQRNGWTPENEVFNPSEWEPFVEVIAAALRAAPTPEDSCRAASPRAKHETTESADEPEATR